MDLLMLGTMAGLRGAHVSRERRAEYGSGENEIIMVKRHAAGL